MKELVLILICCSFLVYAQEIPTTLSQLSSSEIAFDFTQSTGRTVGQWTQGP